VSILSSLLFAGKVTFTSTIYNAASGATAPGETAVYNIHTFTNYNFGCTASSTTAGVAACTNNNVSALLVDYPPTYSEVVPASRNYQAGTATAWSHSARPTGQSRSSKSGVLALADIGPPPLR